MKYLIILIILGAVVYFNYDKIQNIIDRPQSTEQITTQITDDVHYSNVKDAFAQDSLFAVTSKEVIPALRYSKTFEKTSMGGQAYGTYPPVFVLRCMGKETRAIYIVVVSEKFYDKVYIHEKINKHKLATSEKYLSEERFKEDLFHNRFKFNMLDH